MKLKNLLVLYVFDKSADKEVLALIKQEFKKVFTASSLKTAQKSYNKYSPCIIIIENDFLDDKGITFIKNIRDKDIKTAIIVLTNNKTNRYIYDLVELYITKYIIKPYKLSVLYDALLKCMNSIENRIYSNVKLAKGIIFNNQTQSIIKYGKIINLNKKEAILINLFIQNANRVITYEELEYHLWDNEASQAALKSLIRDFRKKTYKDILKNYSKIGYKLNIEDE